ncbi:hypothetical protein, partial [Mitsuaria sp. TWR114]|uniref:hypothetical protein n=1 Tax=Mitsuaria sp. TWR114 TaxID=2601731 RepID=UPI002106777E
RVRQALQRARYSEHLAQLGRIAVDALDPQEVLQQAPVIAAQALEVELAIVFLLDPGRSTLRVAGGAPAGRGGTGRRGAEPARHAAPSC